MVVTYCKSVFHHLNRLLSKRCSMIFCVSDSCESLNMETKKTGYCFATAIPQSGLFYQRHIRALWSQIQFFRQAIRVWRDSLPSVQYVDWFHLGHVASNCHFCKHPDEGPSFHAISSFSCSSQQYVGYGHRRFCI